MSAPPLDDHPVPHRGGVGRYLAVWAALIAFTAVTVAAARLQLPGGWALAVALAIAAVKSALVALFFMHLWDHGGANRLVLATSLFFVALLMGLVLADNATRFPLANPPTEATLRFMPPGPDPVAPAPPARR
ncbi:MAG TPA: cytochrome C oxidase subunit IV family protein [Anaeromyxobacteraceae bacterium]|jgi:cytochrome c oxidase subunit 4